VHVGRLRVWGIFCEWKRHFISEREEEREKSFTEREKGEKKEK